MSNNSIDHEETPTSVIKQLPDKELKLNCENFRKKVRADKCFQENYRIDDGFLKRFLYCAKQDQTKAHTISFLGLLVRCGLGPGYSFCFSQQRKQSKQQL